MRGQHQVRDRGLMPLSISPSPALSPLSYGARRRARGVGLVAVAGLSLALSACDFAVDTPLGVRAAQRAVAPGQPITGTVIYPDGKMTVTLAPAPLAAGSASEQVAPTDEHRTEGEQPCSYRSRKHTFRCSTTGLAEGRYVVQVTDSAQPGEGTAKDFVAVTSIADYDARVRLRDRDYTPDEDVSIPLTGWGAGRRIEVEVRTEEGRTITAERLTADASGRASIRLGRLPEGSYDLAVSDGLTSLGTDGWPYEVFVVSTPTKATPVG